MRLDGTTNPDGKVLLFGHAWGFFGDGHGELVAPQEIKKGDSLMLFDADGKVIADMLNAHTDAYLNEAQEWTFRYFTDE